MAIRNEISIEHKLILTTAEGPVSFDDWKASQEEILAHPDYDAAYDQLIDATRVTQIRLTEDQAWALARRRIVSPSSRRAVVASSPAIFGVGRLMEVHHEFMTGVQVEVFQDMEAALRWLTGGAAGDLASVAA